MSVDREAPQDPQDGRTMTSIDATLDTAADAVCFWFFRGAVEKPVRVPVFRQSFLVLDEHGRLVCLEIRQASKFVTDPVREACRTIAKADPGPPPGVDGIAVRATYSTGTDAAYVSFDPARAGPRSRQQTVVEAGTSTFVLDFDRRRQITGLEIVGARAAFSAELLRTFSSIDRNRHPGRS